MAIDPTDYIVVHRNGQDYKALVQGLLDVVPAPKLEGALIFKGSVASVDQLPANAEVGHFYVCQDSEQYYAWDGSKWHQCGQAETIELSGYLPTSGGEMTGPLSMKDNVAVNTRQLDSGNNSDLQIKRNGQRRILVGSTKVIFDKPPSYGGAISEDNDLIQKKYADANYQKKGNYATGISVHSTVTGNAGTSASVANMGSAQDVNLKFTIPKGTKGDAGTNGKNGSNGSNGTNGKDMVMSTGTNTSPSLSRGKMYWNYNNKTLYIGN